MDYINSDRLLFVVASAGGGGHRLGRIVSCLDNVYWYTNEKKNGINPWDTFSTDLVKGKDISQYHFDRRTTKNMIPLIGERVECYWLKNDLNNFYGKAWTSAMDLAGADEIIDNGKYILWVVHDTPEYLLDRFPNAKIVNLVDTDVQSVIDRYLETTALFPINIENKRIKPAYSTVYAAKLKNLISLNPTPTYRDYWAWEHFDEPVYLEKFNDSYIAYVTDMITTQHVERIKENPKYINVSWDNLSIESILKYLNSNSINENYKILLN